MISRLLRRIFRFFEITDRSGDVYLRRFFIFVTPWFAIYLHEILKSDPDPDLHDHPWDFVSVILVGGYAEKLPIAGVHPSEGWREIWRPPGTVIRHKATDAHRLTLVRPAWSLVFVSAKRRTWGFHAPEGWIPWREYLDRKFGADQWRKADRSGRVSMGRHA